MRVIALVSLVFGFMGLLLLDGQTFSHAVMGVFCGAAAVGCGFGSARKDFSNVIRRREGRVLGALGLVLVIICVVQLPSAYRFETKFNEISERSRRQHEIGQKSRLADKNAR
jgi:hypothetical protein